VEGCNLYKVSEIEQDLVSNAAETSKVQNFNHVKTIIESTQTSKKEKLRLLLIFSIRYEGDKQVFKLKELCRTQGISDSQLVLVDLLTSYAGKAQRNSDLF
jgi:vacuolar protein sorting-associated protein 45